MALKTSNKNRKKKDINLHQCYSVKSTIEETLIEIKGQNPFSSSEFKLELDPVESIPDKIPNRDNYEPKIEQKEQYVPQLPVYPWWCNFTTIEILKMTGLLLIISYFVFR